MPNYIDRQIIDMGKDRPAGVARTITRTVNKWDEDTFYVMAGCVPVVVQHVNDNKWRSTGKTLCLHVNECIVAISLMMGIKL